MPHPNLPVMATSGLDDDVKIWFPSAAEPEEPERTSGASGLTSGPLSTRKKAIERVVFKNQMEHENGPDSDEAGDHAGDAMMQAILRQIQQSGRLSRVSANPCLVIASGNGLRVSHPLEVTA